MSIFVREEFHYNMIKYYLHVYKYMSSGQQVTNKELMSFINSGFSEMSSQLQKLDVVEKEVSEMDSKLNKLWADLAKSMTFNLIIGGIPEVTNETNIQTAECVNTYFTDSLKIQSEDAKGIQIERAHVVMVSQ